MKTDKNLLFADIVHFGLICASEKKRGKSNKKKSCPPRFVKGFCISYLLQGYGYIICQQRNILFCLSIFRFSDFYFELFETINDCNDNVDGKKSNFYWLLEANNLWTKNHQTTYSVVKEELLHILCIYLGYNLYTINLRISSHLAIS